MKKEQKFYWRIIKLPEARNLFKEKKEIYQLFDDGSDCIIENDSDFNDCKESKTEIGIKVLI